MILWPTATLSWLSWLYGRCLYVPSNPAFNSHVKLMIVSWAQSTSVVPFKMRLVETPCYWEVPALCSLVLKFVAFKCLCYTNDSITPPFKCASGDSGLLPERGERMKLTSANSLCPRHLYYDFLLKPYLSYNEIQSFYMGRGPGFAQTNFCLCSGEHLHERPADSAAMEATKTY